MKEILNKHILGKTFIFFKKNSKIKRKQANNYGV